MAICHCDPKAMWFFPPYSLKILYHLNISRKNVHPAIVPAPLRTLSFGLFWQSLPVPTLGRMLLGCTVGVKVITWYNLEGVYCSMINFYIWVEACVGWTSSTKIWSNIKWTLKIPDSIQYNSIIWCNLHFKRPNIKTYITLMQVVTPAMPISASGGYGGSCSGGKWWCTGCRSSTSTSTSTIYPGRACSPATPWTFTSGFDPGDFKSGWTRGTSNHWCLRFQVAIMQNTCSFCIPYLSLSASLVFWFGV